MKIKVIELINTKSFKEKTKLELSNFNIFVGENASGKSSLMRILESMLQSGQGAQPNFTPFNGNYAPESFCGCYYQLEREDIDAILADETYVGLLPALAGYEVSKLREFTNLDIRSLWKRNFTSGIEKNLVKMDNFNRTYNDLSKRASRNVQDTNLLNSMNQFLNLLHLFTLSKSIFVPDTRDLSVTFPLAENRSDPINASNILTHVTKWKLNDRPAYERLMSFATAMLPDIEDLVIDFAGNNGTFNLKEKELDYRIPGRDFSKGSREILVVLSSLVLAKRKSCLFIEEPEIHLHPSAIRKLKSIMLELEKEKDLQITLSTHNPLFLNELYPETDSNVKFFKFKKHGEKGTLVSEIRTDKEVADLQTELEVKG